MKVSCRNTLDFEREAGYQGVNCSNDEFQVYAIADLNNVTEYLLLLENDTPRWFQAKLFTILDSTVPEFWINMTWNKRLKKNIKYDFSLLIDNYFGPKEFIDNEDFLFDIYENPINAYEYFYTIIKSL